MDLGESVNLALLDGDQIEFISQVESDRAMRMCNEAWLRVLPHCTAVGEAVMAEMPVEAVRQIVKRTAMPSCARNTITDADTFLEVLTHVREAGYAVDDGEQELRVRCVAVPVRGAPTRLAISVSGPCVRMTEEAMARAVARLEAVARRSHVICANWC